MSAEMRTAEDGTIYIRSKASLPDIPDNITFKLDEWAEKAPARVFLADRGPDREWQKLSFAEARDQARSLAQFLLGLGLSADRPILVLSGNDLELGLLSLAAMMIGVPIAPVSPAYSLISKDYAKLKYLFDLVTPGLVYVSNAKPFGPALSAVMTPDIRLMVRENAPEDMAAIHFADALKTTPTGAVDAARAATGPDAIAKFLFTSGTTGMPKAVINTQRMLCANQAMIAQAWAFFADEPPVLVDWLPWNHTAGGNHNFGIALWHGGSFYIDDGKPTPGGIMESVRNLKDVSPTFYSSVPKGYEALLEHLESDEDLRRSFFGRQKVLQYAGAGLSQHVWKALERLSASVTGEPVLIVTGYGSTETAPFALATTRRLDRAGFVGLPGAGMEIKLVPNEDKLELRVKGPNVTPGYWRQPEQTAKSFDNEGFYVIGDALAFADPDDLSKGFKFDGRIMEDFKLSSGTWVNCAGIRAHFVEKAAPLVREVVLAGLNEQYVTGLVFPDIGACRRLAGAGPETSEATVLAHPVVRGKFQNALDACAAEATGSSTLMARIILLDEPPSIDAHEVTDKGSINQRAVLSARAGLVEALYRDPPGPQVLVAKP
jgi:feruloyl-CoA synthase